MDDFDEDLVLVESGPSMNVVSSGRVDPSPCSAHQQSAPKKKSAKESMQAAAPETPATPKLCNCRFCENCEDRHAELRCNDIVTRKELKEQLLLERELSTSEREPKTRNEMALPHVLNLPYRSYRNLRATEFALPPPPPVRYDDLFLCDRILTFQ